jgi:gluconate 2-dehydrogenase alpha chain
MAQRLKEVDVVLVGMGWTGAIFAKELAEAGHSVVGLERGRMQDTVPDWQAPGMHDELRYGVRLDMMIDTSRETLSFRNRPEERALPMRQLGSFLPGRAWAGRGCTGTDRPGASCRVTSVRRATPSSYGREIFLSDELTVQDWGITYEELEPYYDILREAWRDRRHRRQCERRA